MLCCVCVVCCADGKRSSDPRDLVDYDVVITAYSILSTESSQTNARSRAAALSAPWEYEGAAGLSYINPLAQVHWRRIILDEGTLFTEMLR